MLAYIYKNKLKYERGQLAPFFIALLVIIIIMVMVTVNLGKVGMVKTDSANGADAGALAGGSIMATVFNGQAVMNSYMIVAYQTFMANLAMAIARTVMIMFQAAAACAATPPCYCCGKDCPCDACCPSPGCIKSGIGAIVSIMAIMLATTFFHISQILFYQVKMKPQAEKGRHSAIEAAFRFAFINSGIGGKLIHGAVPGGAGQMRGDANNYSDTFQDFVKNQMPDECGAKDYPWTDGQDRPHNVRVEVYTQGLPYILRLSILPIFGVLALDMMALMMASQIPKMCICCPLLAGQIAGVAAMAGMLLLAGWLGLFPGGKGDNLMFTPTWVHDIDHNRLFTVKDTQTHGGYEYTPLWRMEYPVTTSKSEVDFRGSGKIYKPKPKFDASIVRVDNEVTQ